MILKPPWLDGWQEHSGGNPWQGVGELIMNMLFKQSFLSSFSHAPKVIPPSPKPKIYEVNFLSLAWRECCFAQTHHPCTMASLSTEKSWVNRDWTHSQRDLRQIKHAVNIFSLKASLGICCQNCLTGSIKEKKNNQQSTFFDIPHFFLSFFLPSLTTSTFLWRPSNLRDEQRLLELLGITLSELCMFFTHPFVTRTPVGATSLLSASKDQRYKFWDDFLLVKSCTKIIPRVKDKTARCHLKIHILFLILPKLHLQVPRYLRIT